jgi:hypothetical protein
MPIITFFKTCFFFLLYIPNYVQPFWVPETSCIESLQYTESFYFRGLFALVCPQLRRCCWLPRKHDQNQTQGNFWQSLQHTAWTPISSLSGSFHLPKFYYLLLIYHYFATKHIVLDFWTVLRLWSRKHSSRGRSSRGHSSRGRSSRRRSSLASFVTRRRLSRLAFSGKW